jgi:hypothetical protein
MKNNQKKIIVALTVIFAIALIIFVFYSSRTVTENFEEEEKTSTKNIEVDKATPKHSTQLAPKSKETSSKSKETPKLKLSEKEESLFNDLMSNKLTDINIQELIQSGFLTETMIERFLTKIQAEHFVNSGAAPAFEESDINDEEKDNIVEGFTGFTSISPIHAKYY